MGVPKEPLYPYQGGAIRQEGGNAILRNTRPQVHFWQKKSVRRISQWHPPFDRHSKPHPKNPPEPPRVMIPRNPTTIALRADDIQDMKDQIAERKAREGLSKQEKQSTSVAGKASAEGTNGGQVDAQMPAKGVPETTLDARKGKSRNDRLGL